MRLKAADGLGTRQSIIILMQLHSVIRTYCTGTIKALVDIILCCGSCRVISLDVM